MKVESMGASSQARSFPHAAFSGVITYRAKGKRMLDLMVGVLMLLAVLPVLAVLLAVVALDGGAPVFGHLRVGRHGRMFRCLKVRSMVPDAEARLGQTLAADPAMAEEWTRFRKLERDPRITPLGRFLRRSSLDELPQLLNVIRGDMSLVGPRPVTTGEIDHYGPHRDAYLSVRPGVTGLWQVSGRNDLDFEDRAELDGSYVRDLSLRGDLKIAAMTLGAVLNATGR